MVDVVDILGIKPDESAGEVARAPQSHLSASQIAQPAEDMAKALEKWSGATNAVAVPLAERQAYADLSQQKVTRDANGNVQVLNPANSVMFGEAGQRYNEIVRQGTAAGAANVVAQQMTDLRIRNPMDANGFKAASDAWIDQFQQQFGGTPWGAQAVMHARQSQTQHYDNIANVSALNSVEENKKSILANIEDQRNTMIGLARQKGTDSPEFKQAMDSYVKGEQSLTSNPLFKVAPASVDLDIKNTRALMQGEALVERVDDTYNKKGKAEAQQVLKSEILENPDLKESDRSRLYAQGISRLAYLTSDERAGFAADKETLGYLRKGIAEGTIDAGSPIVKEARDRFDRNHSTEAVQDLDAIIQAYPHVRNAASTPGAPVGPAAPGDYKQRVAQIENPSGNPEATSVAGATGKYQFMPATWARYGGGANIHGDQEAAMDRLTADNRASLRYGLGRDPSGAELYLAHQQGAQGALRLMAEPGRRAADIVGEKAITQNGGTANMTAGDFVALWKAKFDRTPFRPGAPAADGGPSFTPQQIDANPWLLAETVRAQASDIEDKTAHLSAAVAAMKETVKGGNVPPDDSLAMVMQAAQRDPAKYGMLSAEAEGIKAAAVSIGGGGGGPMNAPQREDYEQRLAAIAAKPDLYQQKIANAALELMKSQDAHAKEAPLAAYAHRFGLPDPPPLDPDPAKLGAAIDARGILSQHIGQLNGAPPPSIFDRPDAEKIKAGLSTATPDAKASFYGQLATLPQDVRNATLAGLGGNEPSQMAEVAAGSLMASAPGIATSIFRGMDAMKTDKRYDPVTEAQKTTYFANRDSYLPATIFPLEGRTAPAGPYATMNTMVRARYADLAAQANDTNYSADRMAQAVTDVTGGVLNFHGASLIAPRRGMAQSEFDQIVKGVSAADLKGATTLGGQPVTSETFQSGGKLENVGDGRYFVRFGDDNAKPVYAYAASPSGNPSRLVLDLSGRTASASPSANMGGGLLQSMPGWRSGTLQLPGAAPATAAGAELPAGGSGTH